METPSKESVLLLRVRAGNLERAMEELKKNDSVRSAEPILGPYDLIVTVRVKDEATLNGFLNEMKAKEHWEAVEARTARTSWRRDGATDRPIHGWTFIRAERPDGALKALQKVAGVNQVYQMEGDYNLLAKLDVDTPKSLMDTLLRDVRRIEGIRRTETLTGVSGMRMPERAPTPIPTKA